MRTVIVALGHPGDTVAAIAGALLGVRWGCSGIPLEWQQGRARLARPHHWSRPGPAGRRTARGGSDDAQGWPSTPRMSLGGRRSFALPHPHDPGVALGNLALAQGTEPVDVEAVVSLCHMGTDPILPGPDVEHVRVWLVDSDGENANLHYVLDQAARQILRLRRRASGSCSTAWPDRAALPPSPAIYNLGAGRAEAGPREVRIPRGRDQDRVSRETPPFLSWLGRGTRLRRRTVRWQPQPRPMMHSHRSQRSSFTTSLVPLPSHASPTATL